MTIAHFFGCGWGVHWSWPLDRKVSAQMQMRICKAWCLNIAWKKQTGTSWISSPFCVLRCVDARSASLKKSSFTISFGPTSKDYCKFKLGLYSVIPRKFRWTASLWHCGYLRLKFGQCFLLQIILHLFGWRPFLRPSFRIALWWAWKSISLSNLAKHQRMPPEKLAFDTLIAWNATPLPIGHTALCSEAVSSSPLDHFRVSWHEGMEPHGSTLLPFDSGRMIIQSWWPPASAKEYVLHHVDSRDVAEAVLFETGIFQGLVELPRAKAAYIQKTVFPSRAMFWFTFAQDCYDVLSCPPLSSRDCVGVVSHWLHQTLPLPLHRPGSELSVYSRWKGITIACAAGDLCRRKLRCQKNNI